MGLKMCAFLAIILNRHFHKENIYQSLTVFTHRDSSTTGELFLAMQPQPLSWVYDKYVRMDQVKKLFQG